MARSIYCLYCGDRNKALGKKYGESFRAVEGTLKNLANCDSCNKQLPPGGNAIAFTSHPRGHEIVMPWESEYLDLHDKDRSQETSSE